MGRVFTNDPGDQGSIPSCVIPNTQKIELDASWLYTQHDKICIKGKVEESKERSSALPLHPLGCPWLWSPALLTYNITIKLKIGLKMVLLSQWEHF